MIAALRISNLFDFLPNATPENRRPLKAPTPPAIRNAFDKLDSTQRRQLGLWQGALYRSPQHLAWVRARSEAASLRKSNAHSSLRNKFDRLANAFDRKQLRRGDLVDRSCINAGGGSSERAWFHSNEYSFLQVVRFGLKSIGPRGAPRVGTEGTNHMHRIATVVAAAGQVLQQRRCDDELASLDGVRKGGLVLTRGVDCTPWRLAFGELQGDLISVARYALPCEGGKWSLVDFKSYKKSRPHAACVRGILEVLAQRVTFCFTQEMQSDMPQTRTYDFLVQPTIVARANASTCFTGMERGCRCFSIQGLRQICDRVEVMLISEAPDDATSMRRMLDKVSASLPANCLHHRSPCFGHGLHRIMVTATKEDDTIGDVHAICVCTSLVSNQEKILRGMRTVIDRDFVLFRGDSFGETNNMHGRMFLHGED